MLNILKADFYRLRKSKIWLGILLGWIIFLLLGNLTALASGGHGTLTLVSDMRNTNAMSFAPNGSGIMAQQLRVSNFLFYFLIPVVLFSFISDFKWGTIKNSVPFKYSRPQLYLAKFIFCSILACLMPLLYCLVGLLMNQIFHGFSGSFYFNDFIMMLKIIGLQAPMYMGFVGVMLLLGILLQSSSAVTAIVFSYQTVIFFVGAFAQSARFAEFEPITCLNYVAHIHLLTNADIFRTIIIGLSMTVLSLILGYTVFRKKEIR